MNRPPKLRTPDHTQLNLVQEKYYRPFIDGYIKVLQSNLKQVKHIGNNYSFTTFSCGKPHDRRNPNWKPFRLLWGYCERTGYDFYVVRDIIFERLAVNWFVNVRCSEIMRNTGGWDWKKCLEWILADQEKRVWSWFSLLFGLSFWSG